MGSLYQRITALNPRTSSEKRIAQAHSRDAPFIDFDPDQISFTEVVQRAPARKGGRGRADDTNMNPVGGTDGHATIASRIALAHCSIRPVRRVGADARACRRAVLRATAQARTARRACGADCALSR